MLEVAEDRRYGSARQMVVDALWRFKRDERVAPALTRLIDDPDVALHAMSALRRTVGNAQAIPTLREVAATHPDERIRRQASQQVKKAEKSASR